MFWIGLTIGQIRAIVLPLEARTSRNVYQNLLISGRDPVKKEGKKSKITRNVFAGNEYLKKKSNATLKSVLLMHSKTRAGVLD